MLGVIHRLVLNAHERNVVARLVLAPRPEKGER